MGIIMRVLITAVAVAAAVWLVPGVDIMGSGEAWTSVLLFAVVLSVVNAVVKPVLKVLSLPITILTLGLFSLFVNTIVLYLAAWLSTNSFGVVMYIDSFGSAFAAAAVISIVSAIANFFVGRD